ncbi:MAG: MerC domain-containing protein [Polyangiales bacterium]|nr:MerC domain-containing protein [Myxococcales bacterium]
MHLHRSQWLDLVGGVLSALCVVHCLALPVLVLALPFLVTQAFETWWAVGLVAVASTAILAGSLSHQRWTPWIPFMVGIALLASTHITSLDHSPEGITLSALGGLAILGAHWLNFRASREAGCSHHHSAA